MPSIARALLTNPRLLLLDEPHEGLAPLVTRSVVEAIGHLKSLGVSMLLSEQQLHLVHETADRIYVVDRGRSSTRTRRSPAATSWSPADDGSDQPKLRVAASLESLGVFASVPAALTRREQLVSSRGSWIRYKGGRAVPTPSVPLGPVGVRRRKQANRHTATLPNPGSFLRRTGLDPFQGTVEGCRRGGFRAADRLRTRLPGVFQEPGAP